MGKSKIEFTKTFRAAEATFVLEQLFPRAQIMATKQMIIHAAHGCSQVFDGEGDGTGLIDTSATENMFSSDRIKNLTEDGHRDDIFINSLEYGRGAAVGSGVFNCTGYGGPYED